MPTLVLQTRKLNNDICVNTLKLNRDMTNLVLCVCVLFYSSFFCISAYANVYFKTTIIQKNVKMILIAGVPSSQAPGIEKNKIM